MARVTKEHNLAVLNPTLAKQWHPIKNGRLTLYDVPIRIKRYGGSVREAMNGCLQLRIELWEVAAPIAVIIRVEERP